MTFLPVVAREMSVLARRRSTYWSRAVTAIIALATMLWLLVVSASQVSLAEVGSSIFFFLAAFCFGFGLLSGIQATSDSLSEEKRDGTLGLLFLTDLKGIDIILGKMAASSLNAIFAMLGVVPMLSLSLLLGGVSLVQIALVAIVLLNSMFLSLSLGMFVSSLSRNERKAMFACFTCLFVITLLPIIIPLGFTDPQTVPDWIGFVSPLYPFFAAKAVGGQNKIGWLITSLLFQHSLSWALLIGASRILPRCVNDLPVRQFARIRSAIDSYVFGKLEQRKRHRAELLDRNAFLWLASRERVKPKYAWATIVFFGLLFLWIAYQFPDMYLDLPVALALLFGVHFVFKLWTASEVCSRLIHDRRSGALELLLSSPLSVEEIAQGQTLALRRIFRWPVVALLLAEVALMFFTLSSPRNESVTDTILLYSAAATTLLLDLWALKWVGLWLSLFGKSIERVLIATIARLLALPWAVFGITAATLAAVMALRDERLSSTILTSLWWLISAGFALAFGLTSKRDFLLLFRESAAQQNNARTLKKAQRSRAQRELWVPVKTPLILRLRVAMRRHWILTGTALLLILTIGGSFARQFYWKRQVAIELRRIRASGQPATAIDIGRFYTPVPAKIDAFTLMRTAGAINWARWRSGNAATQILSRLRKDQSAAVVECETALENNPQQIKALHQLVFFNDAYLDPGVVEGWTLPVDLSGYVGLGIADLVVALKLKDAARTEQAIRNVIALARLFRRQPLLTVQNYCSHALTALGTALEITLSARLLDSDALLRIQLDLEKVDDPSALSRTLSVERARLAEGWGRLDWRFGGNPPMPMLAANGLLSAVGSYDELLVRALRDYETAQALTSVPRQAALNSDVLKRSLASDSSPWFNPWQNSYGPKLLSIFHNDSMVLSRLSVLRAGIAAERFRLQRGDFPSDLQALVPEFIDRVALDVFTLEPLSCTRGGTNFTVHLPDPAGRILPFTPERISLDILIKSF